MNFQDFFSFLIFKLFWDIFALKIRNEFVILILKALSSNSINIIYKEAVLGALRFLFAFINFRVLPVTLVYILSWLEKDSFFPWSGLSALSFQVPVTAFTWHSWTTNPEPSLITAL